jgi:short-subunit dehydrogenase
MNAIVVGASSGIGRELARQLAACGYGVGLAARREDLLAELARELSTPVWLKTMDLARPDEAMSRLRELVAEMKDVELFVISAGTGSLNPELEWAPELATIAVNVTGFAAVANVAVAHLRQRGAGQLVGISSLAALRGSSVAPAYNASKAFVSNYLEGLRLMLRRQNLPVTVTDVQPGLVATRMAQGEGQFWVAAPAKAAGQILDAIRRRRRHAYVTRRWRIIAWFMKLAPDWLYRLTAS